MCIIMEGWKWGDTYTRLCRMHCGCFKASLISFSPSSPKLLSAKHKCVRLLLLVRAKDRSWQPATVRPQLSKLKEKQTVRDQSNSKVHVSLLLHREVSWYLHFLHLNYRLNVIKATKNDGFHCSNV